MMKMLNGINSGTALLFIVLISFIAVFTACVILLIKRAFSHNLSPSFHYYIWLIFVIRLLFPLTPSSNMSVYNVAVGIYEAAANFEAWSLGTDTAEENISSPAVSNAATKPQNVQTATDYEPSEYTPPERDLGSIANAEKIAEDNENSTSPIQIILAVYITIAFAGIAAYIIRHERYRRKIVRSFSEADRGDNEVLAQVMQNLGIRRKISLYRGGESMLIGVFSPVMVISQECAESDKQAVITHELLHYKNKDNLMNCLLILIKCVYWFNPFIHYFTHRIKNDMELLCDVKSIRILNYRKDEYAMMLFNASNKNNKDKNRRKEAIPSQATCMSASGKQLIYRLKFISQFKKSSKIISAIAFVLVAVLIATTLVNPIFASGEEWAQPYAQFLSLQGIDEYDNAKLGDEMKAGEYATALLDGLKSLSLPYELKSKITAIKDGNALIDIANAELDENDKISYNKAITREQAAYVTDTAINYLELYFDGGDLYETPIDLTTLTFIPEVLTADVFENEVLAKIDDNSRTFAKMSSYFTKKDINDPDMTPRAVEELKAMYPALVPLFEKTAVYIFDPNSSERERLEILGYFKQYTTLTNSYLIRLYMDYSIISTSMYAKGTGGFSFDPIYIDRIGLNISPDADENTQAIYRTILVSYTEMTLADKSLTQEEYDYALNEYLQMYVLNNYKYYKLKANVTDAQKKEIAEILGKCKEYADKVDEYRRTEIEGYTGNSWDLMGNTPDTPKDYWSEYEQFDDKYDIPLVVETWRLEKAFANIFKSSYEATEEEIQQHAQDQEKLLGYYDTVDYASEHMDVNPEDVTIYKLRSDISEEAMAIIQSYVQFEQYGKANFGAFEINGASEYKDADKIAAYAAESVDKMHKVGFMTGEDNGSFKPNAKLTWGQSAKIINNILCGICVY